MFCFLMKINFPMNDEVEYLACVCVLLSFSFHFCYKVQLLDHEAVNFLHVQLRN
jgi:hypothetical protein